VLWFSCLLQWIVDQVFWPYGCWLCLTNQWFRIESFNPRTESSIQRNNDKVKDNKWRGTHLYSVNRTHKMATWSSTCADLPKTCTEHRYTTWHTERLSLEPNSRVLLPNLRRSFYAWQILLFTRDILKPPAITRALHELKTMLQNGHR